MKKFLCGVLCAGAIALAVMVGEVNAGEKANVVVSDSAGKALVIKSVTVTSGSSTATASGLGTATNAVFTQNLNSNGSTTTSMVSISGANVTVYTFNPVTGATSTANCTGSLFIWGTP